MLERTLIRNAEPGDEAALLDLWQRSEVEPSATDDAGVSVSRSLPNPPSA